MIYKVFAAKRKPILPSIISSNQTAYMENRCISDRGRFISDTVEVCSKENNPRYFITMNFEKAFDSLDYDFLLFASKKFDFDD